MTKVIAKTYSLTREYQSHIIHILIAGSLIMALFYIFNVYSIITRTVALEKVESQITALQDTVQDLDVKYISLLNKITPDTVRHYGLHEGEVSVYIQRAASLGSAQLSVSEL